MPCQQEAGRSRAALSDVVFSAALKVYSAMSGRRVVSDVRACAGKGYLGKAPSYN